MAVAVEATGSFATVVAASLAAARLPVAVGNPAQVGGGRACVRAALFMGALVAARYNPALRAQAKADRRRQAETRLPSVARKLLTILNAVLRDKQPWRGAVEGELAHAKA